MKCQKELCGAEIPAGVKFCTECGTEVQMTAPDIKTTLCPSCKNIVTEGFKYCCSCGGRIDPALFVDIVCSGTTDNGEKCNTVLTSGTSFCPSCGISHKSNISNNLAGDASLKLGLQITHQKGHTFDETKPLVKKERDSSEYSRSDFWEALTIKQELHDDKTEPEPHDDNNEQEPHDDKTEQEPHDDKTEQEPHEDKTEQVLEPNDDKTESVKDNVEDQNHKENKENKSNNMEQEDTIILISDDKENTERNYNKMEQEDTVILISDSDSAEDGDPNNNEMTGKTSKRKTVEKDGLIKKIKTEKDQNDDIAKSQGIEVDQYDIQESGTGEDPPLENTYMNLTAITDSTKKGQETPKETTQKDTDAKKSDLSHSKVRQKPGMDGKGKCNKCEIEGQWLEDYNKGLMYNERSRPKYLPPPPMGIRVFDRYRLRTYPNPYERRPLPPARVPKHSFMRERVPHVRPPPEYYYGAPLIHDMNPCYDNYFEKRENMYPIPPTPM